MQHIKVKPPVIIGDILTNVIFDSTRTKSGALFRKTETRSIGRRAKINYSENGSHYMKIVSMDGIQWNILSLGTIHKAI